MKISPARRILFIILLAFLPATAGSVPAAGQAEGSATFWTCSMHPQIRLPEPGQCPICFMDLIEVTVEQKPGEAAGLRSITLDEQARKLARVEVSPVVRGGARRQVRMVGRVDYDETRMGTITAWVGGRIDRLFVDYTGSTVRRGQPMARIYSPELLTAQAELIQARAALDRLRDSRNDLLRRTAARTVDASREKLRLLGLSDAQIQEMEERKRPADHITLTAPMGGIVIRKNVTEGVYVRTGEPIYTIADLHHLWVLLEAYESDLQDIGLGQEILFTVEAFPGDEFRGKVAYIDPLVNDRTRTVRIRLNVNNPDLRLKPGMFARAVTLNRAGGDPGKAPLLIPASAPLVTGRRALVYVQEPGREGVYEGREIILGARQDGHYQVKSGLKEGELVVTRGAFKIDSAIQIQGRPSLMNPYVSAVRRDEASPPLLFLSRLNLLNRSFAGLSRAVHQGDRERIRTATRSFSAMLGIVDADKSAQKDRLAWQELGMLLRNDILLLQEADDRQERLAIYATMAEHFRQVRTRFSLSDVAAAMPGNPELRRQLGRLVRHYLVLQQALAGDDGKKALTAIAAMQEPADGVFSSLADLGLDRAETLSFHLNEALLALADSTTIKAIRTAFAPFSQALADTVAVFGADIDTPVYEHFCPMAFDNKGATWLAAGTRISNPYFGAMMLRCGEVRRQIKQ